MEREPAITPPRLFGRPMWSWGGALTTRWKVRRAPDGRVSAYLPLRCRLARRILWPACRLLTGHRQALGETGYGGCGMLDVFCAYCCFPWQVPVAEMPSKAFLADLFREAAATRGPGADGEG